jgi:hypothetical protein
MAFYDIELLPIVEHRILKYNLYLIFKQTQPHCTQIMQVNENVKICKFALKKTETHSTTYLDLQITAVKY